MSFRLAGLLVVTTWFAFADPNADPRINQAELLLAQGRLNEAAKYYEAVYQEAKLAGVENQRLADAASALGSIYFIIDRYREAEALLKQSIELSTRLMGEDAPRAATTWVALAKLYTMQHRTAEAEQILAKARPVIERIYGQETKIMASVFNDLGLIEENCSRLNQAAANYRRAIAIYEKLGEKQQGMQAMVMVNLANVLEDEEKMEEAERVARAALGQLERAYGPDHPFTGRALHCLGRVRQWQGHPDEAKDLYERALDRSQGLGVLESASVQASLASVYTDFGYYPKAEAMLKQALVTRERVLGMDSVENIGALNNLGALYARQKRWTDATQVLERGVAIADSGRTDPVSTVPLLFNLAVTYYGDGPYRHDRYAKAEAVLRRVLRIQEDRFGPDHVQVANVLVNLATVCAAEKHYREARQLGGRAVAIRQAALGPKHPDTVQALRQYTLLLHKSE